MQKQNIIKTPKILEYVDYGYAWSVIPKYLNPVKASDSKKKHYELVTKGNGMDRNSQCHCMHCDYKAPQHLMKYHHLIKRFVYRDDHFHWDKNKDVFVIPLCSAIGNKELQFMYHN